MWTVGLSSVVVVSRRENDVAGLLAGGISVRRL